MKTDTSLSLRMGLTVFVLLCLLVVAVLAITGFFAAVFAVVGYPITFAPVLALVFVGGVALWEHYMGLGLLDRLAAYEEKPEQRPELSRTVSALASQVGIPMPTIALVDTDEPIALTTGLSQSNATIVLSQGILDRLDGDELRAVLAHEVAHIANSDAAVMTVALAPVVLADHIQSLSTPQQSSDQHPAGSVIYGLATTFELGARIAVGNLSRAREFAADRGAVTITGDAAALASALRTLEGTEIPETDLRERTDVAALSVVAGQRGVTADLSGLRRGYFGSVFRYLEDLTRTHPPVKERLERLTALDRDGIGASEE
ncbi:M48 family metallopeptidase [Halogeometricum borinquense]|nr:M48 family metalloprotease [Halogeometricum borinquense]